MNVKKLQKSLVILLMKQTFKVIPVLLLALFLSESVVGQVKKTVAPPKKAVAPPKKAVAPPKKGGVQPKKMTTEDLFKRYLQTEDENLANTIINSKDSLYSFYCQGVMTQELEEKVSFFTKFIDKNPNTGLSKAYLNRGVALIFSEKYDLAVMDLDKTIEMDPKEKYAYYFRGSAYHSLHQEDKAILDFDQAIKMNPSFMVAYQMRGSSYIDKGDFKSAMPDLNKVIESDPMNDEGYILRGMAYDGLEEYNLAIEDWKVAKKLNKENSDSVSELIEKAKAKMKSKK